MIRAQQILLLLNLALFVGAAAWIVFDKEAQLADGRKVLLPIERYDPRSLMQGDYMALRYPLCAEIERRFVTEDTRGDGVVVLQIDAQAIGTLVRVHGGETLAPDEQLLRYRVRWGRRDRVRFASEDFFFQEGMATEFDRARFAELRITPAGAALLVGLCDAELRPIGRD